MSAGRAQIQSARPVSGTAPLELRCPQPDEVSFAAAYGAHGACILRGFISPDRVARLDMEAERLFSCVARREITEPYITARPAVNGGDIFERIDPICHFSPLFSQLAESEGLRRFAAAAVGAEAAIFKDKLIYKLPGDAGYDLHQDYPYLYDCTMPAGSLTSVMIAIDPMEPRNGCLRVYSGYHRGALAAPPGRPRDVAKAAVDPAHGCNVVLEPGDAVFFHPLTPHDSGPNLTAGTRRALFFTYSDARHVNQRDGYYRTRTALAQTGLFR